MYSVLFILTPVSSHFIPTFGLAKKLKKEGFKVIYTGIPTLKYFIEKEGFLYEDLRYTDVCMINSLNVLLGLSIKSLIDKNILRQRYKKLYYSTNFIHLLLKKFKPAILFIDDTIAHYYLFARNHTKNVVLLNTRFFAQKSENLPPLDSDFIPTPTLFSKLYCEWLWFLHLGRRKIRNWIESIAFLGNSDEFYLKRYCSKNNIDWNSTVENQCSFNMNIKNVPSIILSPHYLEFPPQKTFAQNHYLFLPSCKDESQYFTEEYNLLIHEIKTMKNTKILYCSFGTLSSGNHKRIVSFLYKLASVVSKESHWLLVISTGGIGIDLPKSENIHLFKFVPQLNTLQYTDLIITHSGTGTIRECVQMGVPMLAYPLNLDADQKGNAARVVANGFGLRGDMEKDSEAEIMRKINILLTQPFRKHQEVDSEEKVIEILEKIGISLPSKVLS
jgi:UDP:flavonoid glycosyltransferase YjiC (YdhE family)